LGIVRVVVEALDEGVVSEALEEGMVTEVLEGGKVSEALEGSISAAFLMGYPPIFLGGGEKA
jgi:hypothetical protein